MRTLKTLFFGLGILTLLLSACSREEPAGKDSDVSNDVAVLSLKPVLNTMMDRAALKQAMPDVVSCSDAVPAYAQLSLSYGDSNIPVEVTVDILSDENGFYTSYDKELELPIPSGSTNVTVTLNDFLVRSDNGGAPGEVIWAAPITGSEYAGLVTQALPVSWDLRAGSKTYLDVPVLCFDQRQVNLYGYQFFDISLQQATQLCFFANYCSDAGRHYSANYSLDLYLGSSAEGTPLYTDLRPETGMDIDFYAEPICMAVPAPAEGIAADAPYLYYDITLLDWPENYGTAGDHVATGTLSWNEVQALLNDDSTSADYEHIFINCGDVTNGMDTHVLMAVDTRNINEDNINSNIFFIDDRMVCCNTPVDPENYVSLVDQNRKIYWRGRALDETTGDRIDITAFYRKPEGGAEILESSFADPEQEGVLVGKVRNEQVSGFELYSLEFSIINGDMVRTYTVDPKLKMTNN
ncbi:MAG: hypothetical protein WBV47_11840 [Salegentibacter sp.]